MNLTESLKQFWSEILKYLRDRDAEHPMIAEIERILNNKENAETNEIRKELIELGEISEKKDLFLNGRTLLHAVVSLNRIDLVDFLLENKLASPQEKNTDGENALLVAASFGKIAVFEHLLKNYSADFKLTDKNNYESNALHVAAWYGKIEMMDHFLNAKYFSLFDLNAVRDNALSCAAKTDQVAAVKYLLNKGAPLDQILANGKMVSALIPKKLKVSKILLAAEKLFKLSDKDYKIKMDGLLNAMEFAINGTKIVDGNTVLHTLLQAKTIDLSIIRKLLPHANLELLNLSKMSISSLLENHSPYLLSLGVLYQIKNNFVGKNSKEVKEELEKIEKVLQGKIKEGTKMLEVYSEAFNFVFFEWGKFLSSPANNPRDAKKAYVILKKIPKEAKDFFVNAQKILFNLLFDKKIVLSDLGSDVTLEDSDDMVDIEDKIDIDEEDAHLYDLNTESVKRDLKTLLEIPEIVEHGLNANIQGIKMRQLVNAHFFSEGLKLETFNHFQDVPSCLEFITKMKENQQALQKLDIRKLREETALNQTKMDELKSKILELKSQPLLWMANKAPRLENKNRVPNGHLALDAENDEYGKINNDSQKRKRVEPESKST